MGNLAVRLVWSSLGLMVLSGCSRTADEGVDLDRFPHSIELAAQVEEAVPLVETRWVDFGTSEAHDFFVGGWSGDDVFAGDGSTFAWSLGEGSTLQLLVTEPRDLKVEMRLRPYRIDGPSQLVRLVLNGGEVGVLTLKGGMRIYEAVLPEERLVHGRNVLEVHNVYPPNPPPGPPDLGPPGTAWDYLSIGGGRDHERRRPERRGQDLFLPYGTEVAYYLSLPGDAVVSVAGLDPDGFQGRLVVRAQLDDGGEEWVAGELSGGRLFGSGGADVLVEVPRPTLGRLSLAAFHPGSDARGGLLVRRPELRTAEPLTADLAPQGGSPNRRPEPQGQAPQEAGARTGGARTGGARPNVILYLVDTLRADRLGCYGHQRPVSPRIDAFAEGAVVFERMLAASSWTRSSVASLLTGRQPDSHGVRGRDDALAEEAVTLAELLHEAGYATAAFVTNGNAGREVGFGQGFETFELLSQQPTAALLAPAGAVNRKAFAWLRKRPRDRPFFLHLHTMEPHAPYAPPAGAARRFASEVRAPELTAETRARLETIRERIEGRYGNPATALRPGSMTWMQGLERGLLPSDEPMMRDLAALYEAEIFANDRHFGALLDHLAQAGLADSTLVVFVSDHGEEFLDHGGWGHGKTLYQEQLKVPFIVRLPGGDPPRGRVPELVRQVDLVPTLVDLLGLEPPAGVDGETLLPLIHDAKVDRKGPGADRFKTAARRGYAVLDLDGHRAESFVDRRWKLLCEERTGISCRLFDLLQDPREARDLAPERPVLTGFLLQQMRATGRTATALDAAEARIDEDLRRRLQALGYLR